MQRMDLITCFLDTLAFSNGAVLSAGTEVAIQSSRVYREGFRTEVQPTSVDGKIALIEKSTFDAAKEYVSYGRTAVLNFANPVEPGGGVTRGAMAQEECLCRSSNLYPCLMAENVQKEYYSYHEGQGGNWFSDRLIYTKGITVFKDDQTVPQMRDKTDWFQVDVITSAAPYLRGVWDPDPVKVKQVFKDRIQNILEAAVDNGVIVLILGAFGCGAFGNPPDTVAQAFQEIIDEGDYTQKIPYIVFAFKKPREGHSKNLPYFQKWF